MVALLEVVPLLPLPLRIRPIIFLGSGEHLTDLEKFDARSFVSKLLGYGDMSGLIDHIQTISRESAGMKETQKHLAEGIFTIRDMKEQITNIMKMGPPVQDRQHDPWNERHDARHVR